ncbi:TPA: hypothetical protein ACF6LR_004349, partial [Escherichia coli]
ETIWRQSLRGAGFRNLALPAHFLQALPLHDDLIGATTPLHYDVNLPSLTPRFCLHSTQTATFITSVKITCRNSHTY